MSFKIGFTASTENKNKNRETLIAKRAEVKPRKSVVQVRFEQRHIICAYYNDLFDLHVGDMVYVEGKLEGMQGRVVEVSYTFKIKLSDYKKVTHLIDTKVNGDLFFAGSHAIAHEKDVIPYKGIEINDDFMLMKHINIGGDEFHKGDHILRVINHNAKIEETLVKTIGYVEFLSEICNVCGGKSRDNKKTFSPVDDSRVEIIVNFIQKIILDKDMVVPKSLIAKYYFSTLLMEKKTENDVYKIFGLYFFINLFVLFKDKRNLDPIKKALKEEDYYLSIMNETGKLFSSNSLTDAKRNAIFKATNNLDDINLQFRCKSLATLYNYFYFQNGNVVFKDRKDMPITRYLSDSIEYSVEHFVISQSDNL